jgi:hypothetical protein
MPAQRRTTGPNPTLFIGPVAFVLGMAAALLLVGWLGSVVSLAVLGIGAYVVLIVAMALGGALAYAASGWLSARGAKRHD